MITELKWSPFIKSFKSRSVLAGAIYGKQEIVCKLIIEDYKYALSDTCRNLQRHKKLEAQGKDPLKRFGKDKDDNNILHHTYIV